MADTKISAMGNAAALTGTEQVPIVQGGNNVKATVNQLQAAVGNLYANYAGVAPVAAGVSTGQIAIDSSTGMGWVWSGAAWINIF